MKRFTYLIVASLLMASTTPLAGQHDPERNAVRHIALGAFEKAAAELAKGDQTTSERKFVQMLSALKQGKTEAAVDLSQAALKAGLPFGRLKAGPRDLLSALYETNQYKQWSLDQTRLQLVHGPMLGSVTSTTASFWVRTADSSEVVVRVTQAGAAESAAVTGTTSTTAASDYTAVLQVNQLQPDCVYKYEVLVDGIKAKAENTRFQTYPKVGEACKFHVGFGGGAGFVPEWEYMWDTIRMTRPLAFLMLGDNVYIDDPKHDLTRRYCYYRRQSRPEWKRLVSGTSMYAIYDDHDFGLNDCIPGPETEKPAWKRQVWESFQQNWVNPAYGGGETQPGCWHDFTIGDVHFIMLDGRFYRSRSGTASMLGSAQKEWLLETLKNSTATFKVLASPVPWTVGVKPGSNDTWDGFAEEREEIFSFVEANKINGLLLIAADRHRTDLRITPRPKGYDLYEFESSRLTNRHTHKVVQTDGLVWGYNKTCSFARMRFDTTAEDPFIQLEAVTIDGDVVHEFTLPLSTLTHR
jgi:alkaline phosphatase D